MGTFYLSLAKKPSNKAAIEVIKVSREVGSFEVATVAVETITPVIVVKRFLKIRLNMAAPYDWMMVEVERVFPETPEFMSMIVQSAKIFLPIYGI
jgi:hypothetical protein